MEAPDILKEDRTVLTPKRSCVTLPPFRSLSSPLPPFTRQGRNTKKTNAGVPPEAGWLITKEKKGTCSTWRSPGKCFSLTFALLPLETEGGGEGETHQGLTSSTEPGNEAHLRNTRHRDGDPMPLVGVTIMRSPFPAAVKLATSLPSFSFERENVHRPVPRVATQHALSPRLGSL